MDIADLVSCNRFAARLENENEDEIDIENETENNNDNLY